MLVDGQTSIRKHGEELHLPLRVVGDRMRGGNLEYNIQWQVTRDVTWEKATHRPFPYKNTTWADTNVVEQYERAKAAGRLEPEVAAALTLRVPKQRGGKGPLRVVLKLSTLNPPGDAPVALDRFASEQAAVRRMTEQRFEAEVEERQNKLAKDVISKLSWAITFAILASEEYSLEQLARTDRTRSMLKQLADPQRVRGPSDVRRVMEQVYPGKKPLRLPTREAGEALIYTAIIGRDVGGEWCVRRYDGPHTQNATKLTREAGCANLLSIRIEEPTERRMQFRVAGRLRACRASLLPCHA